MQAISHVIIHGRVQGVGFRAWAEDLAILRGVEGFVRNRRDGAVEAVFAGPTAEVDALVEACRQGPPAALVSRIEARAGATDLLNQRRSGELFSVLPTV